MRSSTSGSVVAPAASLKLNVRFSDGLLGVLDTVWLIRSATFSMALVRSSEGAQPTRWGRSISRQRASGSRPLTLSGSSARGMMALLITSENWLPTSFIA